MKFQGCPAIPPPTTSYLMKRIIPVALVSWFALTLASVGAAQDVSRAVSPSAAGTAILTGTVSNTATGNLLEGARVELPQLGLVALSDNTGRYTLPAVPAGTHEVLVSYLGLDPIQGEVTTTSGQRITRDFDNAADTLTVFARLYVVEIGYTATG